MKRYKGELLILCSTVSWGLSYIFIKTALREMDPFAIIAMRFSLAFLITALVFTRQARTLGLREVKHGAILGTLLFCSSTLLATGLQATSVSNAGFIIGSMVLFVAILDAAASRKIPHAGLIAGVLLAMAGIGVLTLRGKLSLNPGDLSCLGSTLFLAIHVMAAQRAAREARPVGASIIQFMVTAALAWAAVSALGGLEAVPGGETVLVLVGLGVVGTAAGFVCQVVGQKFVSPTRTAFIFMLEPVFATVFAWVVFREPVTWHVYVGGGLLLAGVYVAESGIFGKK